MTVDHVEAGERVSGREGLAGELTRDGWRIAVVMGGELIPADADPSPLFETVGALMKRFEVARSLIESRVKPPYGVEVTELHIDMAHSVVAEYVIKSEGAKSPSG